MNVLPAIIRYLPSGVVVINGNQVMEARTNKRIVITGATGTIGSRLVRQLADRGDHVIAFVRDPENDVREAVGAAEYVEWSASKREGEWNAKIDGADAVINLAGAPIAKRWTKEWKKVIHDSRVLGTRHLVEAIRQAKRKPEVLINGSAVGFYGASAPEPVTEASPGGTDFLGRLCGEWEAEAWKARDTGIRVVTVRSAIVLNPDGGALKSMLLPFKLFVGGPIASGRQPWPWIHREDEQRLLLHALDNRSVSGPLNAVAPQTIDNREFSAALGRALGRPSYLHVPFFVLKLLFGEGAVTLASGQKAIPERTLESGFQFLWTDIDSALHDLVG